MEKRKETKWTFVAVHKSRIGKELERATIINLDDKTSSVSSIFPNVFRRKKESETHIFFSLPEDIKLNIRFSYFDEEVRKYKYEDKEVSLATFVELYGKTLNKEY